MTGLLAALGLSRDAAIAALLALAAVAGGAWLLLHDRHVIANHEAKIEAKAAPAREAAAGERAADAASNAKAEAEYHAAIEASGADRPPTPAGVALGCQRLRRANVALPATCGPGGGGGSQAAAHR